MFLFVCFTSLQRDRAPSTPAREKGLEQDVSEEAANLCTPKDQRTAYQNEVMPKPKTSRNPSSPSEILDNAHHERAKTLALAR